MKIDRQNIPEEYQCVNCCPREVDYQGARSLQLQKRKEQSQILSGYSLANMYDGGAGGSSRNQGPGFNNNSKPLEKKQSGVKQRKPYVSKKNLDLNNQNNSKRTNKRNELGKRVGLKRKDLKRSTKKKQKSNDSSGSSDKMSVTLRNWIDNYEIAMTNHYSPELRARLTALGKHQPGMSSDGNDLNLGLINDLAPSCTTVPHAGTKILISTREIEPFASIVEIRGKYMLANQHKAANNIISKKPVSGPFLFFYSISKTGPNICVDTRTYGNEARFVRRSCRPNAEILHNIEKNVIHLYIVAKVKIMASTEITIAHDQNVDPTTRTHSMSHTSTLCACGLVRDCKFASTSTTSLPLTQLPTSLLPPSTKRKNGIYNPVTGEKEKRKYKKRNKDNLVQKDKIGNKDGRGRGSRSTSSSCESHAGLMSPPLHSCEPDYKQQQHLFPPPVQLLLPYTATANSVADVSSTKDQSQHIPTETIMQDPQIFYESPGYTTTTTTAATTTMAPEMVPIAQPQSLELVVKQTSRTLNKPFVVNEISTTTLSPSAPQSYHPVQENPTITTPTALNLTQPPLNSPIKSIITTNPPVQVAQNFVQPVVIENEAQSSSAPTVVQVQNLPINPPPPITDIKSPTATPQKINKRVNKSQRAITPNDDSISSIQKTPSTPGSSKKVEEKVSESSSTPTKLTPSTGSTTSTPAKNNNNNKIRSTETKKLTREERKMEAIVRAFEKMEKNLQRKQEQKAQKSTIKATRKSQNVLKKQNLSTQRRKVLCQRRKKRKSKSISSRTKSSDTNDPQYSDQRFSLTPEKPSAPVATRSATNAVHYPLTNLSNNNVYNAHLNKTDLLMSFNQLKAEADTNLSGIPPLISPACKLIEAAFDSFEQTNENEFKFPKTKTKKDLMNEWLHQSSTDTSSISKPDYETGYVNDSKPISSTFDSDIKMVTKTVEEFISQNRISFENGEAMSLVKHEYDNQKALITPPQSSSPQNETGGSFIGSESAVKKRWLRQAISEETNDENNPVQTEYSTPLKKRRVFMEPTDEDASSSSAPIDMIMLSSSTSFTQPKVETSEPVSPSIDDVKEEIKEELDEEQETSRAQKVETTERVVLNSSKLEEDTTVTSTVTENEPPQLENNDATSTTKLSETDDSVSEESSNNNNNSSSKEEDSTIIKESFNDDHEELELVDEDNKSSNSEEIAEYEKVIASFHTENIMMLQTRNKKSKLNNDSNNIGDLQPLSGSARSKSTPVKLNFGFDIEKSTKKHDHNDRITKSLSPESTSKNFEMESRQVQETIPFGGSRYLNNVSLTSSEMPSILSVPSPTIINNNEDPPMLSTVHNTQFGVKPGFNSYGYRPMMTNLTMNEFPDTTGQLVHSTPVLPGSYLKSYTKATLITDPKAPIGSTLTGQFATVETPGFPSAFTPTSQFITCEKINANVPVTPPNYLSTKSFSSLNDNVSNSFSYTPKVFTKTQSSDPRVNQTLHDSDDTKSEVKPAPKKKVKA